MNIIYLPHLLKLLFPDSSLPYHVQNMFCHISPTLMVNVSQPMDGVDLFSWAHPQILPKNCRHCSSVLVWGMRISFAMARVFVCESASTVCHSKLIASSSRITGRLLFIKFGGKNVVTERVTMNVPSESRFWLCYYSKSSFGQYGTSKVDEISQIYKHKTEMPV